MSHNPTGGRKETRGLWAWRLDTLDPGTSTVLEFGISGLTKGEWNETDVFFRGNGEIIGATKMDEKLLEEQRKTEALEAAMEEVRRKENDAIIDRLAVRAEEAPLAVEPEEDQGSPTEETLPATGAEWFGVEGDGQ
jgi:hypothetical protein